MIDDWNLDADLLAAGAACPRSGCGEINFAYHAPKPDLQDDPDRFEFTCSRCGAEFITSDQDLLFHSVRREWLWAGHHFA